MNALGKGIRSRRWVSIEYARQSTEGYPVMVDLSVGVREIRNRMVTQGAETAIYTGSGRLIDVIPYVLLKGPNG